MRLSLPTDYSTVRAGLLGRTYYVGNMATEYGDPPYQKELQHVVQRDDGVLFKVKCKTAEALLAGPEDGEAEFLSATRAAKKGANKAAAGGAEPQPGSQSHGSQSTATAAPVPNLPDSARLSIALQEIEAEDDVEDELVVDDGGSAAPSLSSAASEQLAAAEERAAGSEAARAAAEQRVGELEAELRRLQLATLESTERAQRAPLAECPPQPAREPEVVIKEVPVVRYLRPRAVR